MHGELCPRVSVQLVRALRYAVHIESLEAIAALALIVSLLGWLGSLPGDAPLVAYPLARGAVAIYFYMVMRKVGTTGSLRLPQLRDYRDSWDTLVHPLLALTLASGYYWAAVLLAAREAVGLDVFLLRLEARPVALFRLSHPAGQLALGVGLVYLPPALAATVLSQRLLRLLDPTFGLRLLYSSGRGYLRTFAALCVLTLLVLAIDAVARLLQRAMPVPIAAPVMAELLVLSARLAQAQVLGRFLHAVQRGAVVRDAAS